MSIENVQRLKHLSIQAQHLAKKMEIEEIDKYDIVSTDQYGNLPICVLERALEIQKKKLNDIIRVKMPEIMNEEGITSVTLDNGVKLELKKGLNPKVVDREKEIEWIESIGAGDSIKSTLTFGKGEVDENLKSYLEENGYSFESKEDVHFQTLKKIISDRYEAGDGLPPNDAIAVETYSEVKIK